MTTKTNTIKSATVTSAQSKEWDNLPTKSAQIRYLDDLGMTRGDIVRFFASKGIKIRYQHVRNVLVTPVKNPKV